MTKVIVYMKDGAIKTYTDYEFKRVYIEYERGFVVITYTKNDVDVSISLPSSEILSIESEV